MICIKTKVPKKICEINDELKAIYHSHDSICIWVFKTRDDRNKFIDKTIGMLKKIGKTITFQIFNKKPQLVAEVKKCGREGIRTPDPLGVNQVL